MTSSNIYIHVPFCAGKCRYCAFYSEPCFSQSDIDVYLAAVKKEQSLRIKQPSSPQTLYIGGGTPSVLGAKGVTRLLEGFDLSDAEVTMEVNPADITPELAAAIVMAGVTRVSMGVQSFDNATLRFLGRRHDADTARRAYSILRSAGVSAVCMDFIAAIPGFATSSLINSLQEAVKLGCDHISVYPLSIEPGTPFYLEKLEPISDDESLGAVASASKFLESHGFERYELSNYARCGKHCRHNMAVWKGEDYTGLGPAACSREGFERRENSRSYVDWLAALNSDTLPPAEILELSPKEDNQERFATRIRLSHFDLPSAIEPYGGERLKTIEKLLKTSILQQNPDGTLSLTPRGREVADSVMAEF